MVCTLFIIFIVWSRFGQAYRSAISNLRNARHETESITEEQRRLFGGIRSVSTSKPPKSKRKKLTSWTHNFVCLAGTDVFKVPTTSTAKVY